MREMPPRVRKLALVLHVVASVGWLGAVAAFLALAVVGLTSADAQTVRGAYLAMAPVTDLVIVPLCLAALATGLLQSLGTPWGLFRHHWVVAKLAITLVSTLILLLHTHPIHDMSALAAEAQVGPDDARGLRVQLLADAALALAALLAATVLSVFKPRGLTSYGRRKLREAPQP